MASIAVHVDDKEFREGVQRLVKLLTGSQQWKMWEDIGEQLMQSVQANFDAEGRPVKWKTWSTRYGAWRSKKKPGKILTLASHLRNSINYKVDANGVIAGTNLIYSAIHQLGGEIKVSAGEHSTARYTVHKRTKSGRKATGRAAHSYSVLEGMAIRSGHTFTMPARPYLMVQAEDWNKFVAIIEKHVADRWDKT